MMDQHPANLLNVTVTPKQEVNTNTNTNIKPDDLLKTLNKHLAMQLTHIEYLGIGINGSLFRVTEHQTEAKYICKVIKYNQANKKQLKKELGLLKTIEANPHMNGFINPCVGTIILKNHLVTVFPVFNGITIDDFLIIVSSSGFNKTNRFMLTQYIIKYILEGIYFFHRQNVCHLQIDDTSILIEMQNTNKLQILDSTASNNNANSPVTQKQRFVPTNSKIYKPNFIPLQIKFTNFGIGCGKITNIYTGKPNHVPCTTYLSSLDPYIPAINTLKSGIKYDIWLAGLLILKLILRDYTALEKHITAYMNTKNKTTTTTLLNWIAKLDVDDLNNPGFIEYLNVIRKHMLCPVENRCISTKFVQELIILHEKHQD